MDLVTQLNRAMAYIEEHLCDDLALEDASRVTSYSQYHFGRLFYYIAGMPLSEYIRKRKLSLAGIALQTTAVRVIDLAVLYGYESADSFARAFAKQHGVMPSAARLPGARLAVFPPLTFQLKIEGVQAMNWRIEEKEPFEVVGVERMFKNDRTDDISGFWDESFKDGSLDRLRRQVGRNDLIGLCGHIDESADSFPYMIGLFADPGCDTTGFKVSRVARSIFVMIRSDEFDENPHGSEIPKLFQRAYSEWLPSSGYDRVAGPDLEIYGQTKKSKYYEEIWLPVKKATAT